jgi:excisionase family DNA binding protein
LVRPYSKTELAEFLNCSERFLEREVAAGRLRKIILGGSKVRFLPRDINVWLERGGSNPRGRRQKKTKTGEAAAPA